ncbi:Ig-like domain-containing protein [Phenylobacterium montanum]|uniref:Tandem-95 repeat protein n=1 Tax=Phenylobacterium montanum TaxID=2823693 RepID=A0A975IVR7_9CAUL|nr:Ig-like domain-containing protein [Caulobacter sp. S6]QUD89133.1 tandem-95 repeat protein [Caulobacter sp. S6]
MSTVYLNFTGQTMATSAAAHAWVSTTAYGQTLTATTTATSFSDSYGGATLVGGTADCTFGIADSSDQIVVSSTSVTDTVNSWVSYTLPTNVNDLNLEAANIIGVGNSGADLMIALAASDTLVAGSGSDVMVDNGAGSEKFQFGANATTDVIYGFQASGANADIIQLTSSPFSTFSQLQSHLAQQGADTLLTISATQQILIRNTLASSLTASNFALSLNLTGVATSFDDEFNSLSLWNSSTGAGTWKTNFLSGNQTGSGSWASRTLTSNSEQEIYVDPSYAGSAGGTTALGLNPFSISNGVLTITASQTPTQDLAALNNFKYISGLLTTQKSFTQIYGYFEIKAELPSGQGVWPAFWLLPADGSWPPELDVMEQIGGKNVYETSHYVNSSGTVTATGFSSYVPGNSTGFHTYGVLWTPTTLAWYVDGVEVATTATPSGMNKPMYMLVNLAIGGNWPGNAPSSFASAQMQVDYVRAYSLSSLNLSSGAAPSAIHTPQPPVAAADAYSAHAGSTLSIAAAQGVLANDTDPNGKALTASLIAGGGPQHGTLTLNVDGSFTYAPAAGYAGADSFTYVASDSAGGSSPTKVTLNVGQTAPTAKADAYAGHAGATLIQTAGQGVLANDVDNNGLALTASLAQNGGPQHGTLSLNADGSFAYTPTAGFAGTDSFTYVASDSLGSSAATTVTLNVTAQAPTTQAASYGASAGHALAVGAVQGVLAGDADSNGLSLTAALAQNGGPQHGALSLNPDGSFTYTPNAGFAGTDSFTYIASDSLASGAPTTVTLNVAAQAPTTQAASYDGHAGQTLSVGAAQGVLASAADNNGLTLLTAALATNGGPQHGTLTLNADGSFSYTPTLGYAGPDSFTYVASDILSAGTPTTVTINVLDPPPTTQVDAYGAAGDVATAVSAAQGVLANDIDNNGLTLTAALATNGGPSHGTLTLNGDGSFSYTPTLGYVGADSFTYIASDSLSSSAPTTVTLNVAAQNITGGTGGDTYYVYNSADQITVAAGTPNESVIATCSYTLPANIQNLTLNGSGLTGAGNALNDTLTSLGGPNTLVAGTGVDTFYVNNTGDVVINNSSQTGDLIISSVSYTLPTGVHSLRLTTPGTTAIGNAAGGNYLTSVNGGDTLVGGAGGNDVFSVSHSNDVVQVAAGTPNETVNAWCSYTLSANVQNLVAKTAGAVTLVGNTMNNVITAGTGADILTGGGGADTFVVGVADKLETVTDFTSVDRIDISAFQSAGLTPTFTDYGTYSTVGFSNGDVIKLLGVHASSLAVSGHYIV